MLYEFSDRQLSTARKLLLPTGRKETIHATFISSELLMENELNTNLPRRTLAEYIHCRLSFYLDLHVFLNADPAKEWQRGYLAEVRTVHGPRLAPHVRLSVNSQYVNVFVDLFRSLPIHSAVTLAPAFFRSVQIRNDLGAWYRIESSRHFRVAKHVNDGQFQQSKRMTLFSHFGAFNVFLIRRWWRWCAFDNN